MIAKGLIFPFFCVLVAAPRPRQKGTEESERLWRTKHKMITSPLPGDSGDVHDIAVPEIEEDQVFLSDADPHVRNKQTDVAHTDDPDVTDADIHEQVPPIWMEEHKSTFRSSLLSPGEALVDRPEGFEGTSTYDLFLRGLSIAKSQRRAFGAFSEGKYKWFTYRDIEKHVQLLGNGMDRLSLFGPIELDQRTWRMVGVYSEHRLGWTMLELAAARQNITLVPLYETLNPSFVREILKQTQLSTVFASTPNAEKLLRLVNENGDELGLRRIVLMGSDSDKMRLLVQYPNTRMPILLMKEVKSEGLAGHQHRVSRDDINTICYTSGTTGDPKGAMITHGMLISVVGAATKLDLGLTKKDRYFAFLPPAHILERVFDLVIMYTGASIGYYSGELRDIPRDMGLVSPTVLGGVPRSLETTLTKVDEHIKKQAKWKRGAIAYALRESGRVMNGQDPDARNSILGGIMIRKLRSALGGRVRLIISGGGRLTPETQAKLKQYFHVYVAQGYGLTESTGGTMLQSPRSRTYDIVGVPLPCVEAKLVDQDQHSPIRPGAGEILLRGPSIFRAYFRKPIESAASFTPDGWFRTGDIGVIVTDDDGNKQFSIVGRSKEIFKLANGEFCIPTILESYFKIPDVIDEVFVGPSQSNDGVAILVNVNQAYMNQFVGDVSNAKVSEGSDSSKMGSPSILTHAFLNSNILGLRESITKLINETAHHFKVSRAQMPKFIAITGTYFGPLSPFVTSTMKLKRPMLQSLLMDIVAELNGTDPL